MVTGKSIEGELLTRIRLEFEKLKQYKLASLRKELSEMIELDFAKPEEIEPEVEKREREYQNMDVNRQVEELTNNFYMWWPGGHYRELLQDREAHGDNPEKIAADEKMIRDLDRFIADHGYVSAARDVSQRAPISAARAKLLGEAYLCMLDNGYDRQTLVA